MMKLMLIPLFLMILFSFKFFMFLMILEYLVFGLIINFMMKGSTTWSIMLFFMSVTAAEAAMSLSLLMFSMRGGAKSLKMLCEGY